jgi:hypothetical protein
MTKSSPNNIAVINSTNDLKIRMKEKEIDPEIHEPHEQENSIFVRVVRVFRGLFAL